MLVGGESLEQRRLLSFDPSPIEQALMEDVNRMRTDPQGELNVLFSRTSPTLEARDRDVDNAIDFFNVSRSLLLSQWSALTPVAPVAWNEDLIDAALAHTQVMRTYDTQSHQVIQGNFTEPDLGQRLRNEGYQLRAAGENIYSFAESHIHGHAGFVVDWGDGPGGIQDPPGHRDTYMNGSFQEVGISVLSENNPATSVGPLLITQDFGRRANYQPQVLGVVYRDQNSNGIYDPGEGLGNAQITVAGANGTFTTRTLSAGGYQLVVPPGTYQVTASGISGEGSFAIGNVTMANANVKVDFETNTARTAPRAVDDVHNTAEDAGPSIINVVSNDTRTDAAIVPSSVQIIQSTQNGTIVVNQNNGNVTYTPNSDFSGSDRFTYSVADTFGTRSNVATVRITVANRNDPPVASNTTLTVTEDNQNGVSVLGSVSDPDGGINWSSLEVVTPAANGTISINVASRRFIYTPNQNYSGSDSFTYRVADTSGAYSNTARIDVTVTDVNDPPQAEPDVFAVVPGQTTLLTVINNDFDPEDGFGRGTTQLLTPPQHGEITTAGHDFRYTATAGYTGGDSFTYRMRDLDGGFSNPATVNIFVVDQATPWQNPVEAADVNGDGLLTPLDALTVINNMSATLTFPSTDAAPPPFIDVDGSQFMSPLDALIVINRLNAQSRPIASLPNAATSSGNLLFDPPTDDETDSPSQFSMVMSSLIDAVFATEAD